ncbi:MAG: hypothetical protein ACFHWZ_08570 [Phycisphaerales bacterium]
MRWRSWMEMFCVSTKPGTASRTLANVSLRISLPCSYRDAPSREAVAEADDRDREQHEREAAGEEPATRRAGRPSGEAAHPEAGAAIGAGNRTDRRRGAGDGLAQRVVGADLTGRDAVPAV